MGGTTGIVSVRYTVQKDCDGGATAGVDFAAYVRDAHLGAMVNLASNAFPLNIIDDAAVREQ